MPSSTNNVKLGVCTVLYDGVDLGFTQGGVEVEVQSSTHEVKVDQFGETPVNELIMGRTVMAKVPLAETTIENLVAIMPGAVLVGNGTKATGTVTFATAAAANNDVVTIKGQAFTFKTAPAGAYQVLPGASFGDSAANLAAKINAAGVGVTATVAGGVVTLTCSDDGADGNAITLSKTGTNITVSGATLTGGVDATKKMAKVSTGVSVSLLDIAKTLILRPKGTSGEDDFTIWKAACPGAMSFAYKVDQERIFNADFKGYAMSNGDLFALGDITATA